MTIFLTTKKFDAQDICYGFFGRKGGVSDGVYASLNAGRGSHDDPQKIEQNRRIIADSIGVDGIINCYQIHSDICHIIEKPPEKILEGDALVTTQKDLVIGVLTADCGPILFHGLLHDGKPIIGAAHAGWGGALRGILESTIDKMIEAGAELKTIKAMVGPCIGPESYEVSEEFLNPFLERDEDADDFFVLKPNTNKFLFDLPAYIEVRLKNYGIQTIIQSGIDTYKEEADYFSYRRKTHKNEPDYGRQMAVIVIK